MVLLKRLNPLIHSNNPLWRLFTSDSFMVSLRFLIFNVLCHTKCSGGLICFLILSLAKQYCCSCGAFFLSSRSWSSSSFGFVEIAFFYGFWSFSLKFHLLSHIEGRFLYEVVFLRTQHYRLIKSLIPANEKFGEFWIWAP